jgi:hypothetical protein
MEREEKPDPPSEIEVFLSCRDAGSVDDGGDFLRFLRHGQNLISFVSRCFELRDSFVLF